MIEIPMVNGTVGGMEILERLENALVKMGGRPHWGQVHFLSGSQDAIRKLYPRYDDWVRVIQELNSAGTFDNEFTKRCGFSR